MTSPVLTAISDRSHLKNSRPLRWDRVAVADNAQAAVDHLLSLLEASEERQRARKGKDRERLRATLEAITLDLYAAAKADPARFLAYSRNRADYGKRARYDHPISTLTSTQHAANFLVAAGLADHKIGSYTRRVNEFGGQQTGRGYLSRIRATPALLVLLEGRFGLSLGDLGVAPWAELIRLKGQAERWNGPKPLMLYDDTADIADMRENLKYINEVIASCRIELEQAHLDNVGDEDDPNADERPDAMDRSAIRLYRVFNNGRFDHGGRFYGGWWQAASKKDRARITINGEATVELDFRSLHPRLCYHLTGQPLPPAVDPYAIGGMDGEERRQLVKKAFSQLLNVTSGAKPKAPKEAKTLLPKKTSYKAFLASIEEAHQPIRQWFRGGRGLELQQIDSAIADSILRRLTAKGIPCLPVHDSFIVPISAEHDLGQAMYAAYFGELVKRSDKRDYPVITGWSSPRMAEAFINQNTILNRPSA